MSDQRIPDGVYANPSGEQTVTVSADQVRFHVTLIGSRAGQVFERDYAYALSATGEVVPRPVRSIDGVFGIGTFRFVWDGQRIRQYERATGELLQDFQPTQR